VEAPADETDANRDARRERNRRRKERRRHLRDSLPIRNLAEALERIESRAHTTPEQCLILITAIARHAQGIHAGEVIAKLAEDAYFMRVDNRVSQPPPARNRDNEATSCSCRLSPIVLVQTPAGPHRVATATVRSSLTTALAAAAATAGAPTTGPTGGMVAEAVAEVETTQTATPPKPHRAATTLARRLKSCGGRSPPPQATTTTSPPSLLGFTTCSSRTSSNLSGSPSTT
jgi:hypothetical protein